MRIRGDEAVFQRLAEAVDEEGILVGRIEGRRIAGPVIHAAGAGDRAVGRFTASPLP